MKLPVTDPKSSAELTDKSFFDSARTKRAGGGAFVGGITPSLCIPWNGNPFPETLFFPPFDRSISSASIYARSY
jgi:hypothetical protein